MRRAGNPRPLLVKKRDKMEIERLEYLIKQKELTYNQRNELKKAADEAGIEYITKSKCSSRCYERLILKLYEHLTAGQMVRNVSKDGWRLKSATESFAWQGHIVSNANIKGMTVGAMPSVVVETFFEKAKKDNNGQGGEI